MKTKIAIVKKKHKCPIENKCCTSCVIYKATINNEKN